MTDIVEIHVTFLTLGGARKISHLLLDGGLAACINIGKEVDSRYTWQGEKYRHDEWLLVIKTPSSCVEACCETIRKHYTDDTPAMAKAMWPRARQPEKLKDDDTRHDQPHRDPLSRPCRGRPTGLRDFRHGRRSRP